VNGTLTTGTNSTVQYSATNSGGNINITNTTYNHLQVSGSETYDLTGNLTGIGNLTIDSGATLDSTASNYNIDLTGNWLNQGTFTPRSGTVTFSGAGTQTLNNNLSSFTNLIHSGAGTLRLTNHLDVNGNFSHTAGTFDANGFNQNFAGDVSLSNGTTYTKGGTITFDGTAPSNYTDSNTTKQNIGTMVLNKTDGTPANNTLTLMTDMSADASTISANNTLDLNGHALILPYTPPPSTPDPAAITNEINNVLNNNPNSSSDTNDTNPANPEALPLIPTWTAPGGTFGQGLIFTDPNTNIFFNSTGILEANDATEKNGKLLFV
jgi:hypothetical protein